MCGLVGIAGDCSINFRDIFTDLLVVDSLRGPHSTGAAAVDRWKNEIGLAKQPGGPHNLITTPEYKTLVSASRKAIIGHNRFATVGEHTVENAHPFQFSHLVGAHNGTLEKYSQRALPDFEKYGTDSEAIFASINNQGLRKTVDLLQGAWALVWFDQETGQMNFLRNDKRPLFYTYSGDRCTLLWASEISMLEFVMLRSRTKMFNDQFYTFDPDVHHTWDIPDSINKKFDLPKKEEMKALSSPSFFSNWTGHNTTHNHHHYASQNSGGGSSQVNFRQNLPPLGQNGGSNKGNNTGTNPGSIIDFSLEQKKKLIEKFRPPYKDTHNMTINKKRFAEMANHGCVFCGDQNVQWGEFIKPLRSCDGPDVFLCKTCYMDDDITDICRNLV